MSDSSRPHGLQPTRLLRPWDFPGKSSGVVCHCFLRASTLEAPNHRPFSHEPLGSRGQEILPWFARDNHSLILLLLLIGPRCTELC